MQDNLPGKGAGRERNHLDQREANQSSGGKSESSVWDLMNTGFLHKETIKPQHLGVGLGFVYLLLFVLMLSR